MSNNDPWAKYAPKASATRPTESRWAKYGTAAPSSTRPRPVAPDPEPDPPARPKPSVADRIAALGRRATALGQTGSDTITAPAVEQVQPEPVQLAPVVVEERGVSVPEVPVVPDPIDDRLPIIEAAARSLKRGGAQIAEGLIGAAEAIPNPVGLSIDAINPEVPLESPESRAGNMIRGLREFQEANAPSLVVQEGGAFDPDNPRWWLERGLEQAPQLLLAVGAGMATGGLGAFALPTALQEGGRQFLDTREALLASGDTPDTAETKARGAALLTGVGSAALETIPGSAILLKRVPGAAKAFSDALMQRLAGRIAVGAGAEGLTEVGQEAWSDAVQFAATEDPEVFNDWANRYAGAGALGAGVGGVVSAATGVEPLSRAQRARQVLEERQQPAPTPEPETVVESEAVVEPEAVASERTGIQRTVDSWIRSAASADDARLASIESLLEQNRNQILPEDQRIVEEAIRNRRSEIAPEATIVESEATTPQPVEIEPEAVAVEPEQAEKEAPKTRIVASAVRTSGGRVFTGPMHDDAITEARKAGVDAEADQDIEKGFLTSEGRYVGRDEALAIQRARSEVDPGVSDVPRGGLDSEDLDAGTKWVAPRGEAPNTAEQTNPTDPPSSETSAESRPENQTEVFRQARDSARTMSDELLLARYQRSLRNQLIAGADAASVQGMGGRRKVDYADPNQPIGMVGTGAGSFQRGRQTQEDARVSAFEQEIRSREGLTLPTVEQAFAEVKARDLPLDLRDEFAEIDSLDDAAILEQLDKAEEAAYAAPDDVNAQIRRAIYAGVAERRNILGGVSSPVVDPTDDDLPFDRIANQRKEAERIARRDPTTQRIARAVRGDRPAPSSGRSSRLADTEGSQLPPRALPQRPAARRRSGPIVDRPASKTLIADTGFERKAAQVGGRTLQPIAPVELTRFATELLGGKAPFLKRYPAARGAFYADPDNPRIGLNPELGRDYDQFAKTLAHEVGHLVDFVSDNDIRRGNILGRIASLRRYLKETIDALPSEPSRALTPQDRKRFRQEAMGRAGPRPEIEADLEEWREDVSAIYSDLVQQAISDRNLLTREQVQEELLGVSEWWRPYDPETAPPGHRAYRESSIEVYADALSVLLNSPGSLQERAPNFFDAFFAYLDRKPEAKAAYDRLQETLAGGEDAVFEARRGEIREDFAVGEEKMRQAEEDGEEKRTVAERLKQLFIDRSAPVTDAEGKRLGKAAAHSHRRAAKMALQELSHGDNVNRLMLMQIEEQVHQPMVEAGLTDNDAGELLILQRIAEGDRGGMAEQAKQAIREITGRSSWEAAREAYVALNDDSETSEFDPDLLAVADSGVLNPHGYTPEEAKRQIEGMRRSLGEEKFERLDGLMRDFRNILFQSVEEAVRVGSYSVEVFESKILPNKDTYAPFAVLDYFNGTIPAGVRGQMGTLKGVANPYLTAVLKTMTLNRLNEHQKAKQAVLGTIDVDLPGMAGPENKVDRFHQLPHPKKGRENLTYLKNGRLHYREVDDYIAAVFDKSALGPIDGLVKTLNSKTYGFFHPLYVTFSIGWQARNVPRDWKRTFKNLAAAHADKPTLQQALAVVSDVMRLNRAYLEGAGEAWDHARRRTGPLVKEMLADRALGRAFHSFEPRTEDVKFDRLMQQYGIRPAREDGAQEKFRKLGRAIETVGVFQETWSKVAAYKVLTDKGITGKERAYIVRNYAGTPDSSVRGLASDLPNALFMYSNVILAGWRADMEVGLNPSTASGYWLRAVLIDYAPKMVMAAAVAGFLGEEVEEWMERVPSYDLEKYIVIPIPPFYEENELGEKKAVYFRMPHDDVNRVLAAVTWVATMSGRPHRVPDAIGIATGEFPGVNPGIDLPLKWVQALSGRNPYDSFRGREVVPQTEWEAGGWDRMKEMLRYTLGEFGIASQIMGYFTNASPDDGQATVGEKITRSIPGLSSLIKVTDRGLTEQRYWELDWEARERAKIRADLDRSVRRASSERSRLNRFGVERLSPVERRRRGQLNAWYRTRYLPLTSTMEAAREAGDDTAYERAKKMLDESVPPRR